MKKYEKPMITDVIKLTELMAPVTVSQEPNETSVTTKKIGFEDGEQLAKGGFGSVWDK